MLFTVEIGEEWLDALDETANMALSSSLSTPEEAIEAIIYFQIKLQLIKRCGKCFVNRAVHPLPKMVCL